MELLFSFLYCTFWCLLLASTLVNQLNYYYYCCFLSEITLERFHCYSVVDFIFVVVLIVAAVFVIVLLLCVVCACMWSNFECIELHSTVFTLIMTFLLHMRLGNLYLPSNNNSYKRLHH
jgi:hypothetical protein